MIFSFHTAVKLFLTRLLRICSPPASSFSIVCTASPPVSRSTAKKLQIPVRKQLNLSLHRVKCLPNTYPGEWL